MSGAFRRHSGTVVFSFAVILALTLSGSVQAQLGNGQNDDLLDLVRRRERVEMQRVEAGIRQGIKEAQVLLQSSPPKAVEKLKETLAELEKDTLLPKEKRESFTRTLNERLRAAEAAAARLAARAKEPRKQNPFSKPKNEDLQKNRGADDVDKSPETIKEARTDNNVGAANRPQSKFAETRAQDPIAQARERTTQGAVDVLNARKLKKDRERSIAGAFQDLDNSATAPGGDTEFPKDWKERTKGRSAGIQLTDKEKAILTALNKTMPVNFQNTKLEDVISYLQDATGQPILLDKEALKDVEASYDSPVTLSVKSITVRTALRRILADLGLTYIIRDQAIQVTSAQRAKEMMVTRRYYVGDLLAGLGGVNNVGGIPGAGPVAGVGALPIIPIVQPGVVVSSPFLPQVANLQAQQNAEQLKQTIEQLKEMIVDSVDPQSWFGKGGAGTIAFHAPTMSFIIRQSAEVHTLLGAGLLK
jgi:hypothetical protein